MFSKYLLVDQETDEDNCQKPRGKSNWFWYQRQWVEHGEIIFQFL